MASYYTRAKARSDLEGEEMEQRDVAPIATSSTSSSIVTVGLHVEFTGESESMSTETAGPATTHPELRCGDAFPIERVLVATYLLSVEALPHCRCGVANKGCMV